MNKYNNKPIAKYQFIADEIRRRIYNNVYPPKELIPDQNALADEFKVSRMTVKKALDILANEGLIYKRSGVGTFVLGSVPFRFSDESQVTEFDGLTKSLGTKHVKTKVIDFDLIFPDEELRRKLGIEADEPVYDIRRLRYKDDQPLILEHTYMSERLIPGVTREILKGSLYSYVHKVAKQKFGGAYRKIHADKASDYDIKYLEAEPTDPILEVEQIVWLNNGVTLEYSLSRNLYSTREYSATDIRKD